MLYLKYILALIFLLNSMNGIFAQDTLILNDGNSLIVEVLRIDESQFYYKEKDELHSVSKKKVKEAKFSIGWQVELNKEEMQKRNKATNQNQTDPIFYGNEIKNKKDDYLMWVTTIYQPLTFKGRLNAIEDSLIVITKTNNNRLEIPIQNINTIKVRKRGKIGKGILIGGLTGLAIGGAIGFIGGSDCSSGSFICFSREETAIIAGGPGMLLGALIGGIAATARIEISIYGRINMMKKQKATLLNYKL